MAEFAKAHSSATYRRYERCRNTAVAMYDIILSKKAVTILAYGGYRCDQYRRSLSSWIIGTMKIASSPDKPMMPRSAAVSRYMLWARRLTSKNRKPSALAYCWEYCL